jgi:hypothetical protein
MQGNPQREESSPGPGGQSPDAGAALRPHNTSDVVRKRAVFHVPGFDPAPPAAVRRRLARELRRFEETWSVKASVSDAVDTADEAAWRITTSASNWRVETYYRLVRWDDVIEQAGRLPMWRRVPLGLVAFFDFAVNALAKYLRANWRYALFFLFPFVLLTALATLAVFAARLTAAASGSLLVGTLIGVAVFAVLLQWPGKRLYLPLLFDDWIFSRGYVRHSHPVLEPRFDRLAEEIAAVARADQVDEILVIGHSLGAALAIDVLDRALRRYPELGRKGPRLALISVGSSILKIGLHARAIRFRAAVERVASAGGVFWGDYQALSDVMNFYKSDPTIAMGLSGSVGPVVRIVRIRHMLEPAIYGPMRRDPLRLHCQFVSGNTRRTAYDYFMLLCGPLFAERQVRSPDGALSAIASDGRLADAPVAAVSAGAASQSHLPE